MEETTPHQLQRVYATICYKWRCSLEGKVRCTSVGASTISCPQLVLRHTLTHARDSTDIYIHTLKDNWMLAHADAWNRPACHEKKTKKHLHYHTLVDSQALEPTLWLVQPFDRCINSRSKITFLTLLPLAPSLHKRHSNRRSAQMLQLWAKTADRLAEQRWSSRWKRGWWTGREERREGGERGWWGWGICRHIWRNESSEGGCGRAHHFQTRSRIPEGSSTAPGPLLPAARAILPPRAMTSSSKT